MNQEYDNLPVFWGEIAKNYTCAYSCKDKSIRTCLIGFHLHRNYDYLKEVLEILVELGYFDSGYFYHLTEKGYEMIKFHGFLD